MRLRVYLKERVRMRALTIAGTGALAAGLAAFLGPVPEAPEAHAGVEPTVETRSAIYEPPLISALTLTAAVDVEAGGAETDMAGFAAALGESLETQTPEALAEQARILTQAVDLMPRAAAGAMPAAAPGLGEGDPEGPTDG
jgi:hypothetical protein